MPTPINIGEDNALTKPTIKEPITAPGIEPSVPRTIIANEGSKIVKAVSGVNRKVIAKIAPPMPETPAERNALVNWILSTLIPLLAANSGLSETARIRRPSRVFRSKIIKVITVAKTSIGMAAL